MRQAARCLVLSMALAGAVCAQTQPPGPTTKPAPTKHAANPLTTLSAKYDMGAGIMPPR